jgi:hypothetical protein
MNTHGLCVSLQSRRPQLLGHREDRLAQHRPCPVRHMHRQAGLPPEKEVDDRDHDLSQETH